MNKQIKETLNKTIELNFFFFCTNILYYKTFET